MQCLCAEHGSGANADDIGEGKIFLSGLKDYLTTASLGRDISLSNYSRVATMKLLQNQNQSVVHEKASEEGAN